MGMYCPRTLTEWDLGNIWYWENLVLSLFYCSQSLFNMLIAAVCFPGLLADVSWSVTADRRSALLTLYHNASWWHGKYSQTRGLLIVCLAKGNCPISHKVSVGTATAESQVVILKSAAWVSSHLIYSEPWHLPYVNRWAGEWRGVPRHHRD